LPPRVKEPLSRLRLPAILRRKAPEPVESTTAEPGPPPGTPDEQGPGARGPAEATEVAAIPARAIDKKAPSPVTEKPATVSRKVGRAPVPAAPRRFPFGWTSRVKPLPGILAQKLTELIREAWARFPVRLAQTEHLGETVPLAERWYWLLATAFGGMAVWAGATILLKRRLPWVSIGVALLVAIAVIVALGVKFGVRVGIIAASIAVLSMLIGEIVVQQLHRASAIKLLDLARYPQSMFGHPVYFYRNYFYFLIVHRLLPAAVVAFLVGWWPLPRRFWWKGFRPAAQRDEAQSGGVGATPGTLKSS
jgi:hypothetical protein